MTELAMDYQEPFDNAFTRPAARTWMQILKTPDYEISTKQYPLSCHHDNAKVSIVSLNFINQIKVFGLTCYRKKTDFVRVYIGETARYAGITLHSHVAPGGVCENLNLTEDQKPKALKAMAQGAFCKAFYTPEWLEKYPKREESYNKLHTDYNRIREVFCHNFSTEEAEEIEQSMAKKVAKAGKLLNC